MVGLSSAMIAILGPDFKMNNLLFFLLLLFSDNDCDWTRKSWYNKELRIEFPIKKQNIWIVSFYFNSASLCLVNLKWSLNWNVLPFQLWIGRQEARALIHFHCVFFFLFIPIGGKMEAEAGKLANTLHMQWFDPSWAIILISPPTWKHRVIRWQRK